MFEPTVKNPAPWDYWANLNNKMMAERNTQFSMWLEVLQAALIRKGHTVLVDFLPGGVNAYFTLPDTAWLKIDGYDVYACIGHMTSSDVRSDPVRWAETQVSDQKAFGRVQRD